VNLCAKIGLSAILMVLLYYNLTRQNQLESMWRLFQKQVIDGNKWWLFVAFLLLPFNWLTETLKWQPQMKRHEPIGLFRAFKAVLAGVSFSLFTPNRVGEYGGRVLFVQAENRWKAFIINLVGNFSQILVILSFGLFGALWLYAHSGVADVYLLWVASGFATLGVAILVVAFFNLDIFIPLARRIPYVQHIKRYVKDVALLREFSRRDLLGIMLWSVIRFLIYSTQYFCVARFYGIEMSVIDTYTAIFAIFLLQTGLPLPPILGLVARGSVAVQIFGFFQVLPLNALATTFSLWVINLILPALLGLVFVLNINFVRIFGYDRK
jgi:MFS family permease